MGNVMAATPVAGPTSPVVPPPVFVDDKTKVAKEERPTMKNPGTVEDLHKKCKGTMSAFVLADVHAESLSQTSSRWCSKELAWSSTKDSAITSRYRTRST